MRAGLQENLKNMIKKNGTINRRHKNILMNLIQGIKKQK